MAKTKTARANKTTSKSKKKTKSAAASGKKPRRTRKSPTAKSSAEPTVDRRVGSDRRGDERRRTATVVEPERRKIKRRAPVNRRRQIDPTTCEREYTTAELEYMQAMERYKRSSGRQFPTCSEQLEVLLSLGYAKVAAKTPEDYRLLAVSAEVVAG